MIAAIDWGALGQAAWTSVLLGLGVLLVATVAVTTSLRSQDAKAAGNGGAATLLGAVTVVCVIGLAAVVVLGIYIMADK